MSSFITRRSVLLGVGAALAAPLSWAQDPGDAFTGFPGTRVRFASVEVGRSLLMADDEWVGATSEFQRRTVMSSATPVTLDAFRRWNGDAVRAWPTDQRARWQAVLDSLAPAFAALRIPLPTEVWLIASNGQESAGAPYTRGHAVVMAGTGSVPGYSDAMLLAHELWHVAARHAPALASRLYTEIGFEPMPELSFPAAWAPVRIANPDAPQNRHALRLQVDGRTPWVTPVLVASRTVLEPGESFFSVMEVRLLEVEPDPDADVSRAVLRDGHPVWHALDAKHDYLRRLGGNTGYVIHCEEAMADNVALLATGATPRNPALLVRINAGLQAPR
ncbi:MAG: hypothetical protein H7Y33_18150 [Cytophagales bacterium]|nr:hypothetical protein [Rhizobacter sp.]